MTAIGQVLQNLFNQDFTSLHDHSAFSSIFFKKTLTIPELQSVFELISQSSLSLGGKTIPAAMHVKGKQTDEAFLLLAQIHGNEPAGLAAHALVLALAEAGLLERDVILAIGNPLAASQYFEAYSKTPHARQETRDAYRCGLDEQGNLLPDMNRIPVDFMEREPSNHHTRRAQELYTLGTHVWGVADLHSARGNMVCITDHKNDADLKHCPIRAILTELAEAISAHASGTVTLKTLKTILMPLPNIQSQTGIEAGKHEAPTAPYVAASFTLSLFYRLGITKAEPLSMDENGVFKRYGVRPRITYADLAHQGVLHGDDMIYMAKRCTALASVPQRSDTVIVQKPNGQYGLQLLKDFSVSPEGILEYAIYQYDEMEAIPGDSVVAVAIPSGIAFKTTETFSGIFLSKSAALFDKDPAVGPWPVPAAKISSVKFCYPCNVSDMTLEF
jgi:hypothetical protein